MRPTDDDIDREIRDHLTLDAEERRADGAAARDAGDAARRAFGSVALAREDTRGIWTWQALERVRQDVRYGLRSLGHSPVFTLVTLAILALGIGANTTIFSIVNSVLLRPLPYHEPERLMMLDERLMPRFERFEASPLDVLAWREKGRAFESIAAYVGVAFNRTGDEGPERIPGMRITANLPDVLGVKPLLGRAFTADEDRDGGARVVLISHGFWRRVFGADPNAVGRVLRLNEIAFTVVGVMPAGFRFPTDTEIWTPMAFTKQDLTGQNNHFVWGVGRLRPGVTREQAEADLEVVMRQIPETRWSVNVRPIADHYVGHLRNALTVLLGAAGAVLLIACANVAGLLLARASVRQREIALRASLGAGRWRLAQQLLTETMVLALAGGAAGCLLAWLAIRAVRALPLTEIPRLDETSLDLRVLLFTLAASTLTGLLFGLAPAWRLSRTSPQDSLRAGTRVSAGRTRLRQALVSSEIALALVLLVGAGLLLGSVWRLLEIRPGFAPDSTLTARIDLPFAVYAKPAQQRQFVEQVVERLQRAPAIRAAGVSTGLPFVSVGDSGVTYEVEAGSLSHPGAASNHYRVTPDYFRTLQIPLVAGRFFDARDTMDSPPVAIINETVARRFFAGESAIGRRLGISDDPRFWREIVGVVGDVKQEGLRAPIAPQVYEPYAQRPGRGFSIVVRAAGDPAALTGDVRRAVHAVDPRLPLSTVQTLETLIARSITRDRFAAWLLSAFGALAAGLAAIGLYGLIAYSVAQRTSEIGLRMALGADRRVILRLLLGESARLVAAGLIIGLVAALAATRALGTLLYEVQPRDPATIAAAAALLTATALAAAFVPARRAARLDPVTALRSE